MRVTSIKLQSKTPDRYAIYIDAKYVFSLGPSEVLDSGLKLGKELSSEEFAQLKDVALAGKAYDRVLNLLSIRARSSWEIRNYLERKNYSQSVINKILNRLSNAKLIDDKVFAEAWVRNRRLLKKASRRRLVAELRQKRIADDIIEEVLKAQGTDEREVLRELVERKKIRYPDRLRLMQYLARQGYKYEDIKAVLDNNEDY